MDASPPVAVIGAGIAGLSCARALENEGLGVRVFDKARGPGGRMATRRGDAGRFDHGAPFFTAEDPRFAAVVQEWSEQGLVAPWEARTVTLRDGREEPPPSEARFVCVPRMNALARHLADASSVEYGVRITELRPEGEAWLLVDEHGQGYGPFARVVVATPAPQAVPLLAPAPALARRAASAEHSPCLAAMVTFATPLDVGFDAAHVEGSPLSWLAREASKPGREPGERWVLHGSPEWSEAQLEGDPSEIPSLLLEALGKALGRPTPPVVHQAGHRWRYARVRRSLREGFLLDDAGRIAACGDWCAGDGVEAAWRSGLALADALAGPTPA